MRTHLDLFSGIGGFALAAGWAGFTTVQFCEIDPFCQKVLKKHWPEVPIHDDIRTLTADVVGQPIDLLTGGFPCQPFSVAGKQLGAADDRHLWPEMARVIDECRPRWILGENTPGIIGMELDNCLADLESIGYEAWPVVIPACGVGAWHQRQRVWIVAHADTQRSTTGISGSFQRKERNTGIAHDRGHQITSPNAERGGRWESVRADTAQGPLSPAIRQEGAFRTGSGGEVSFDSDELGQLPPENEIRAGCNPAVDADWWSVESRVRGVPDGLSTGVDRRAARLKALGNAIVPQVAYQIMKEMEVAA